MNALQRALDRARHPGEYSQQRAYRRWLTTLAANEPVQMARPIVRRVDIMCRCQHVRADHVVISAAQAVCTEACPCAMFRAERVVVE